MKSDRQFRLGDFLLLIAGIGIYLAITIELGLFSILFWSLAAIMTAVIRPAHQRRQIPESVTDVLSVAVAWAVVCGIAGFALDVHWSSNALSSHAFPWLFSWTIVAQLTGFYLGLVWVLIVLLIRHVERVIGMVNRARPVA